MQGLVEDLGFNPEEVGTLKGKGGVGPDSGAQRRPLVAAPERTDMRDQRTRAEAVEK